jgi:hypothetical protein
MKRHLKQHLTKCVALNFFFITSLLFSQLYAKNNFVDVQVRNFPSIPDGMPHVFELVSHGRPGELFLNGKWRNAQQIVSFIKNKHLIQPDIKQLNIYGCEFGKGSKGKMAVAAVQKALKIDVAASDNITGKHGDWVLEVGKTTHSLQESNYPYDLQTICRDTTFTPVNTGWSGATAQPPYSPPVGCVNNSGVTTNSDNSAYGWGFITGYDSPNSYYWSRSLSGLSASQTYRVRISIVSFTNSTDARNSYFQNYSLAGQTGTFTAHGSSNISDQTNYNFLVTNQTSLFFGGTIATDGWNGCNQAVDYYMSIVVEQVSGVTVTYTAPTPSASTVTNICPATTSNLTGIATGCGSGSVVEWHNTNVGYSNATKLANITSVANGTYYAICFNATRSCYSSPSSAVTVTNSPCTPLPIDLKDINAVWDKNDAILNWTVASESDVDHYIIERSLDGITFTKTGKINSVGNHVSDHDYTFRDVNVRYQSEDKILYRLTQVEKDGQSKVSSIVSLQNNEKQTAAYIYPNPITGDNARFVYYSDINEHLPLDLCLTNIYGRELFKTKITVNKGKNQLSLPLTNIIAGVYFLKFTNKEYHIKGIIRIEKI